MKTRHETATDLHATLRLALRAREPEICDAIEWLEVAVLADRYGGSLDIDEVGLAIARAQHVVDGLAQGEGEMPLSVYREASKCGALDHDWDAEDMRECHERNEQEVREQ